MAAALQDSGRAVLIGTNSYGKGTVQTVPRLPNNGEISLTWARYFAPSGYTLNHIGVLPSICTNNGDQDATELLAELGDGKLNAGAGEGPQHDLAGGYAGPGQAARRPARPINPPSGPSICRSPYGFSANPASMPRPWRSPPCRDRRPPPNPP